jgi:hypothetical protein
VSDPQPISGIDVSELGDGTLTLAIKVISREGAEGPEVVAQIEKSTSQVSVATSTSASNPTSTSPIPFTITFSNAVSGLDVSALAVTNGIAANLQSSDNITWTVDVTPLAQGAVGMQVPAGVTTVGSTPNSASNETSVIFDSEAPSGYSVAFLASTFTSAAFEIRGAEIGAAYSFTVSSSGGGTPVAGTGTIVAAQQQITGLDLSGLGDGTLTLSVTLTDALGNAGSPITGTMTKDASPPVIVSITPPAAGIFNDL